MDPLRAILKTLKDYDVDFVTIGNLGAQLHGVRILTEDADVALARGRENRRRLMGALKELKARYRLVGNARGRRMRRDDPELLSAEQIWNLTTKYGPLDLLYDPAGGGYDYLVEEAVQVDIADGCVILAARWMTSSRPKRWSTGPKIGKCCHNSFGSGASNLGVNPPKADDMFELREEAEATKW